jgi:hypothetical protein
MTRHSPGRSLCHPLHPILVTIPIGAWVSSLVFRYRVHIVGRPGILTQASQWLIAICVIGRAARRDVRPAGPSWGPKGERLPSTLICCTCR